MEQEWESVPVVKPSSVHPSENLTIKHRIHRRFCSNPPVAFDKIGIPKKACTMREQQLNEAERIRKVHN